MKESDKITNVWIEQKKWERRVSKAKLAYFIGIAGVIGIAYMVGR